MTTEIVRYERWSSQKWRATVTVLVLAQLGFVFAFGRKQDPVPRSSVQKTRFKIRGEGQARSEPESFLRVMDPTLFALPSSHGFTGPAWFHAPSFTYDLTNWNEGPEWLELEVVTLGESVKFDGMPSQVAKAEENAAGELHQPELLGPKPVYQSTLSLEGDIVDRLEPNTVLLPSQPFKDLLAATVIQVAVEPDGRVVSAQIWSSSGSKEADLEALRTAKTLLFTPQPNSRNEGLPAWGKLHFQWFTVEPSK
jgi:TonB family protein